MSLLTIENLGVHFHIEDEDVEALRDEIFAEVNYHAAYEPMRCVRSEGYKYIRRYDGRERLVLPNIDETPAKQLLLEHGWTVILNDGWCEQCSAIVKFIDYGAAGREFEVTKQDGSIGRRRSFIIRSLFFVYHLSFASIR